MTGKAANQLYCVWISPRNRQIYILNLGSKFSYGLYKLLACEHTTVQNLFLGESNSHWDTWSVGIPPRKEAKAAGFKDPEDKVKTARKKPLI